MNKYTDIWHRGKGMGRTLGGREGEKGWGVEMNK